MSVDVKQALAEFPNTTRLLGESWLLSQFELPETKRHLATFYFQRAFEDKETISESLQKLSSGDDSEIRDGFWSLQLRREPTHSMILLEKCLPKLESQVSFGELIREMKKSNSEFESSISVAFYAYYFMQRGKVELFPQIKLSNTIKKTPDIKVTLESRPIYVEVTTPGMAQVLEESLGKVVGLKQRAPGQIIEEYDDNFRKAVDAGLLDNVPLIIGLDCSHSEIRDYDVEAAILGSPQLTFTINTQTHQLVSQEWTRKKDSGISPVAGTEMISAVIWSKDSALSKDGKFDLIGQLFQNPKAKNVLSEVEIQKIDFRTMPEISIDPDQ